MITFIFVVFLYLEVEDQAEEISRDRVRDQLPLRHSCPGVALVESVPGRLYADQSLHQTGARQAVLKNHVVSHLLCKPAKFKTNSI